MSIAIRVRRQPYLIWLLPLLLYVALGIPAAWMQRELINPDAIAYIRLSRYLLAGDWHHAFSGYWSPLYPCLMAPLIATGMDGLLAAHLTLALCGGLFVWMAHRLLRQFEDTIPPLTRLWMLLVTACVAVHLMARIVSPDLLMGAVLMGYLATAARSSVLVRPRQAFRAGVLGGMTYLAKAYALPFFLVQFPVTLLMHALALRRARVAGAGIGRSVPARRLLVACAAGLLGFSTLAGPWIGLLSHRYGRLTMATAGPINHNEAARAPAEVKYRPTFFVPPDPYITEAELLDQRVTRFWSPLESWQRLRQQWEVMRDNVPQIVRALAKFDGVGLVPIALVIGLISAPLVLRGGAVEWRSAWLAMTIAIYCAGFTAVYFEPRLIEAALWCPAFLLCVLLMRRAVGLLAGRGERVARGAKAGLPCLVFATYTVTAVAGGLWAWRRPVHDRLFRDVAASMRSAGLRGPIACSSRGIGAYVAYFLDAKLITIPATDSPEEYERDCRRGAVQCLLINRSAPSGTTPSDPTSSAQLVATGPGWVKRLELANSRAHIDVYSRARP